MRGIPSCTLGNVLKIVFFKFWGIFEQLEITHFGSLEREYNSFLDDLDLAFKS